LPNNYFQFKEFTIFQDKCALKVSTEACIFGAYLPKNAIKVLDIGTGTGLLSLMYAQKSQAQITAVEIDSNAAQQATFNVKNSNWHNKITVIESDIVAFSKQTNQKFDLIISNPPFYQQSLLSNAIENNIAKHAATLSLIDLAKIIPILLEQNGRFYVLLPKFESEILKKMLLSQHFHVIDELLVRTTEEKSIFRIITGFSKSNSKTISEPKTLLIKENNSYTDTFKNLLQDYYLDIAFEIKHKKNNSLF
jgi:tRNA1Val (adenine37-N6)-methyltransferase